jgi:hypothetical protein
MKNVVTSLVLNLIAFIMFIISFLLYFTNRRSEKRVGKVEIKKPFSLHRIDLRLNVGTSPPRGSAETDNDSHESSDKGRRNL